VSEVQRYDKGDVCGGEYNCGMVESETGDYVEYSDYENLQRQLAEASALAENRALQISKLEDQLAELKAKVIALHERNDKGELADQLSWLVDELKGVSGE
jgi:hypothetical protein